MTEVILEKLREIEEKERVKILLAVESGSRAWGFPSKDSDYDVRFVYVRDIDFYLHLERTRDVIEWQLDETWDINGWDLQKFLRLLKRSNPSAFEWAGSPIVYYKAEEWSRVEKIMGDYFNPLGGCYHYLSMARKNYTRFKREKYVNEKRYFYVLRALLACKWIKERMTPPPVAFAELVKTIEDESVKNIIARLMEIKINNDESKLIPRISVLDDFIERNMNALVDSVENVPQNKESYNSLNKVFLSFV